MQTIEHLNRKEVNLQDLDFISVKWLASFYTEEDINELKNNINNKFAIYSTIIKIPNSFYKENEFQKSNSSKDQFEMAIKSHIILTKIIAILLSNINLLAKITLPMNRNVYFYDEKFYLLESYFLSLLRKKFRNKFKQFKSLVSLLLIINSKITSNDINKSKDIQKKEILSIFFEQFKYLLGIFKICGMKRSILQKSKCLLVEHHLKLLEKDKEDFFKIFHFFKNQKHDFATKFFKKIEKMVLEELYAKFDDSKILEQFMSLDNDMDQGMINIKYALKIFNKINFKDRIMKVYENFMTFSAKDFWNFVQNYTINQKILKIFKDCDFNRISDKIIEVFFDCSENNRKICNFFSSIMKDMDNQISYHEVLGRNPFTDSYIPFSINDIMNIIVFLIEKSKAPENILMDLQKQLALRLFSYKFDNESFFLNKEIEFLKRLNRIHNEKMLKMIEDYKNIQEDLGNTTLFMTNCKWPVFKTENVFFDKENPISIAKLRCEEQLRVEKKRISWIDMLSKVKIELFNVFLDLSLYQYRVILKIIEDGKIYKTTNDLGESKIVYRISEENIKISKIGEPHFNLLLDKVIYKENGFYCISSNIQQPVDFNIEFANPGNDKMDNNTYNTSVYFESKISRIMKKNKNFTIEELNNVLKGADEIEDNKLKEYLSSLEQKGILELNGEKLKYLV